MKMRAMQDIAFRGSTLSERKEFYEKEFSISKIKKWFKKNNMAIPQVWALDAGTDSKIILKKEWKGIMFYFPFKELEDKIKKYLPEDIYYDRNIYEDPEKVLRDMKFEGRKSQELVFDVDADNIECKFCKKDRVCNICLNTAYGCALKLKKELEKIFDKVEMVYSGKGFHLHVLDKKAWDLKDSERRKLNAKFKKFPIDPWVSAGNIRLVRVPYTLNALVSRITTPIEANKWKLKEKFFPNFIKKKY